MPSPPWSARAAPISSAIRLLKKASSVRLQIGLRELLDRGCNAAIITPVDCPPLSAASLERLHQAFLGALTAGFWAVAPEHDGKHGHPLLASRDLIDAFLKAPVTGNAREVLHAHASRVVYVPVPESLAKAGLNTPQDYAALVRVAVFRKFSFSLGAVSVSRIQRIHRQVAGVRRCLR